MGVMTNNVTASIAESASLSGAVFLGAGTLVEIHMPSGWDAAQLTFQISDDGVTYRNLKDPGGNEITYEAAASVAIKVDGADAPASPYLKIRSGTSAVAVNQTAARSLKLVAYKPRAA